jgi:hypothetical protein
VSVAPRVMTRNWRLKLAALGLAVFLWAVVRADPVSTTTVITAPVAVEASASPEWTLANNPDPPSVSVYVRGSPRDIQSLQSAGVIVRIPVATVTGNDTVVTLRPGWASVDGALSVERIEPAQVALSFERSDSAARPVSTRTVGQLPDRQALAQPLQLSPVVVRVRGPASRVASLDSIPIVPFDLSEVRESGDYPVSIDTMGFPRLAFATTTVSVQVRLEAAEERELGGVPVIFGDDTDPARSAELSVDPPLIQVFLRGGRTRVAQVSVPELRGEIPGPFVETMMPGEVRRVPIRLVGVPELVEAEARPDSVLIERIVPSVGGSGRGGESP